MDRNTKSKSGARGGAGRRIGSADSSTRSLLLDAAVQLLLAEGAEAVTVRHLADHAGLKRQIVHYYFRSMEDLFAAALKRTAESYLERQKKALETANPIRAIWELASYPDKIRVEIEFMALANRFNSVREIMADYQLRSRRMQSEAVNRMVEQHDIDLGGLDAEGMMTILRGIARSIVMERNFGLTSGHSNAIDEVERHLREYDRAAEASGA